MSREVRGSTKAKRTRRRGAGSHYGPQAGFFVGSKSLALTGRRLRLPQRFSALLRALREKDLWVGPLPGGSALVLCPSSSWSAYRKYLHEIAEGQPEAERILFFGLEPKPVDPSGRVTLDLELLEGIGVRAGERVRVVGTGKWLELRSDEEWASTRDAAVRLLAPPGSRCWPEKASNSL